MSFKKRGKKNKAKRGAELSPRLRETLEFLLRGESEKQIAARMELSKHTVHEYVKALYKRFSVSTRAELLARWVSK
jgi:DNA-binding NarL/FixJ family response regulator